MQRPLTTGNSKHCMLRSSRTPQRQCMQRTLRIRAADESNEESKPRSSGFKNPFQARSGKQNEAQRALQDIFKDKEDSLSMYDPTPPGKGGSGGKNGGGGGGFGSWRDFDWRDWGKRQGGSFLGSLEGLGQVLGAVLLFGFILALVSQGPPAVGLIVSLVRSILGLGGSSRSGNQLHSPHQHHHHHDHHHHAHDLLGPNERYVMEKYGSEAADARTGAKAPAGQVAGAST